MQIIGLPPLRAPSIDGAMMDDFLADLFLMSGEGDPALDFDLEPLEPLPEGEDRSPLGNDPVPQPSSATNQSNAAHTATSSRKRSADSVASADESDCVTGKDQDTKKLKRLQRNRESASLSRERKKHVMKSLEQRVRELERMNSHLNYALATKNYQVQQLSAELDKVRPKDDTSSGDLLSVQQGLMGSPTGTIPPSPLSTSAKGTNGVTESAALTADSLQLESTSRLSTLPACSLLCLFFLYAILPVLGREMVNFLRIKFRATRSAAHMQAVRTGSPSSAAACSVLPASKASSLSLRRPSRRSKLRRRGEQCRRPRRRRTLLRVKRR